MSMTTSKIQTGEFSVLWNGVATEFTIFNGDMGISGRGSNAYAITNSNTGKTIRIGSLQKAKKTVEYWLSKR